MKPNIFEYSDYREYLKAYYSHAKRENKSFSYRYFGMKAGYNSPNLLHMIVNGKRNLSKNFVTRFAEAMELSKQEQHYFEALVSFNNAKTPEAKRYYLELLHGIRKEKIGTLLKDAQFYYLSTWYYSVIRELVALPDFQDDPRWIKKQLNDKISTVQAREAIETLLRLGLIKRGEDSKFVQTESTVKTEPEVSYTAVYSYHQQMLSLAKDILATTKGDGNNITGMTMPISKRQYEEIKRMINEFQQSVARYLNDNPDMPDAVSQMNIQLLTITNPNGQTRNGGSK